MKFRFERMIKIIQVNDYIEGYEYYGDEVRKIKGWVDKVFTEYIHIQADDEWDGYRGTTVYLELGEIIKLEDQERPIMWK